MKTAIEPMARNSDCQFWRLRSQKSAFANQEKAEEEGKAVLAEKSHGHRFVTPM